MRVASGTMYSSHIGDDVASSSGTNVRSILLGMGFASSLVEKAIGEKGEEDVDLLLDTLVGYSALKESNSESSDSLDSSLNEIKNIDNDPGCDAESHPGKVLQMAKSMSSDSLNSLFEDDKDAETRRASPNLHPKQEPDVLDELVDDKRASLLMMNFSKREVDFAIDKLGINAPIDEIVDFIYAAQIAENEKEEEFLDVSYVPKNEPGDTEKLFGTMDTTLRLLEMGFNDQEVSMAIEKFGTEIPITELANWICLRQIVPDYDEDIKPSLPATISQSVLNGSWCRVRGMTGTFSDTFKVKMEEPSQDHSLPMKLGQTPKPEPYDEFTSFLKDFESGNVKGKRPKEEYEDYLNSYDNLTLKKKRTLTGCASSSQLRRPVDEQFDFSKQPVSNPNRNIDKAVQGPPYFLYGNVVNISNDSWHKISQFLYALQPEFINTQLFSALSRKEGYIHNLPIEDRSPIDSKSPKTIWEAMPNTKKWWPLWDTRKQLSCISSETTAATQICEYLRKMLIESRGVLSEDQQTKVLHYCRSMNLVWVGQYKLAPVDPENLERILGYPVDHTRVPELSLAERLEALKNCFQTNTLGYHLSVLKSLFPKGLTLLSLFSGTGGAEVTLHRLGIHLKAVVSVESSEFKRKMLRKWWQNSEQTGELVQIEGIQKLSGNKLEFLMKKFGGFDIVICQTPCILSSKGSREVTSLDFSLFYEFVRVLQRVKSMMGRNA